MDLQNQDNATKHRYFVHVLKRQHRDDRDKAYMRNCSKPTRALPAYARWQQQCNAIKRIFPFHRSAKQETYGHAKVKGVAAVAHQALHAKHAWSSLMSDQQARLKSIPLCFVDARTRREHASCLPVLPIETTSSVVSPKLTNRSSHMYVYPGIGRWWSNKVHAGEEASCTKL
jgi:hypothetical protein